MLIRVFISIPLKDPGILEAPLKDVADLRNTRASPASQSHITLRFIGDMDDGKVKKVVRCVEDAVVGIPPFAVVIKGSGCFPDRKRPSVVWVGAEPQDTLRALADRISSNLKAANINFDSKPFKSHITIGRCKGPTEVDGFLEKYRDAEFGSFLCEDICVMRSELGPRGAKHTVLARIRLPDAV